MGEGIAHIISPMNAPWSGWMMLALLVCCVLAEVFQPGVITQTPASLIARTDRTYKESPMNFFGQLFITLFRIGTLGMALCMSLYTANCSFGAYSAVCGLVLAVLLIKMLCQVLIDFTFAVTRHVEAPYEHYANIATIASVLLYLALLAMMRFGNAKATLWVLACVTILFLIMWLYRSVRLFVTSPKTIVYLLLYVATLEVLPLVGLYYMSEKLISIL